MLLYTIMSLCCILSLQVQHTDIGDTDQHREYVRKRWWDKYPPFFKIWVTLTMFGTLPAPFSSAGNWGRLFERAVLFWSCWALTPAAPICCTPAWPYCWPNGAPDIPIYSEQTGQRVVTRISCSIPSQQTNLFTSALRVCVKAYWTAFNFENAQKFWAEMNQLYSRKLYHNFISVIWCLKLKNL